MNTPISSTIRASKGASSSSVDRRKTGGFTLIELMIVLAVVAVMVGAGAPAMTSMIRSIQLTNASNDLLWGLFMARSEAVKRKSRVVVCKSADGIVCAQVGGWEQGWLVFQDNDNDGQHDQGETILHRAQPLPPELRVTGNVTVARYVSYAPTGATQLIGGNFQAGTITLCRRSADSGEARQIVVSSSGRPRVQKSRVEHCA
jgi:type IV fimbrial biogenesis protein FimT